MAVVAVTGGIAAGKSLVARRLRERGAIVIDADLLAREAVAPGSEALAALEKRFGPQILGERGELERATLGALVFGNPSALADLNSIVHPEVRRLYDERLREAIALHPEKVIVYDVPLLTEARSTREFDAVVVVHAPSALRVERLVKVRGLSEAEARSRVESQISDEERLALADVVIDASTTEESTLRQADALFDALTRLWPDRLDLLPRQFLGDAS